MSQGRDSLRVLELSQGLAGAVCGRILAGLGHDVIKCEPPAGDYQRTASTSDGSDDPHFLEFNAGKRGVVAGDDQYLLDLAGRADIVIVDNDPDRPVGAASALRKQFPSLVVVSVSTFGQGDPAPDAGSDSLLAEAYGGLAFMIGEPDRAPLSLGGEQACYISAAIAVFGAMLAVRQRETFGIGDLVDVSLVDAVAYLDWKSDVRRGESPVMPRRTGAASGRWQMVPARTGWVGVIFLETQWPKLVELVGDRRLEDPELADEQVRAAHPERWWPAIREWIAAQDAVDVYTRAQAAGLPFGYLVSPREFGDVPQFRARGFVPETGLPAGSELPATVLGGPVGPGLAWHTTPAPALGEHQAPADELWPGRSAVDATAGPSHEPATAPRGTPMNGSTATATPPLRGIRVVDLGTITAGAAAGRMLADYGADVIKVESPTRPDSFRRWIVDAQAPGATAPPSGVAPMFDSNNAGKLGVALDLKSPEGLADLKRLVTDADVLVENFSAGVAERLGIGFDALVEVNPDLIYLSLSSQGQRGPESMTRSYGSTLDLLSGLSALTGYGPNEPMWSSVAVNYPDQLASVFGAMLVVASLHRGGAVHLDISQREVVAWTLSGEARQALTADRSPDIDGCHRQDRSPHQIYRSADTDGWVAVSARTDRQRAALAELAVPKAAAHPELRWWLEHTAEVDEALGTYIAARTTAEAVQTLNGAGVPAVPVSTPDARAADPRFCAHRVYLDDGPRRLKGFPLRLQHYAPPIPAVAPGLGEHTTSVLASISDHAGPHSDAAASMRT